MGDIKELGKDPIIRDKKRLVACPRCELSLFKLVAYERNMDVPYLECVNCEAAIPAQEEIDSLIRLGAE